MCVMRKKIMIWKKRLYLFAILKEIYIMIMVSYKQFQLYLANKKFFCNKIKLVSLKKVADPDEKFYNLIIHMH